MVDECLQMVTSYLNDFPHRDGISKSMSPTNTMLGRGQLDGNHLQATFGRYYEVFLGTDDTNKERRINAICLRPSNNQGGYCFFEFRNRKKDPWF